MPVLRRPETSNAEGKIGTTPCRLNGGDRPVPATFEVAPCARMDQQRV